MFAAVPRCNDALRVDAGPMGGVTSVHVSRRDKRMECKLNMDDLCDIMDSQRAGGERPAWAVYNGRDTATARMSYDVSPHGRPLRVRRTVTVDLTGSDYAPAAATVAMLSDRGTRTVKQVRRAVKDGFVPAFVSAVLREELAEDYVAAVVFIRENGDYVDTYLYLFDDIYISTDVKAIAEAEQAIMMTVADCIASD